MGNAGGRGKDGRKGGGWEGFFLVSIYPHNEKNVLPIMHFVCVCGSVCTGVMQTSMYGGQRTMLKVVPPTQFFSFETMFLTGPGLASK